MNKIEQRKERKKEQIFNTLTGLIARQNFKEFGIRKIARSAGVAPASIYNYFGSKEELLKQFIYRYLKAVEDDINKKMDVKVPFKEKMNLLYELFCHNLASLKNQGFTAFILEEPTVQKHFDAYLRETYSAKLIKIIEQGKARGEVPDALSSEAMILFIRSFINTLTDLALRQGMDEEMQNELKALFFYGILGAKKE